MNLLRVGVSFVRTFPMVIQIGLVVLGLGGVADLVYHTLPGSLAMGVETVLGPSGSFAHVVTVIGMVLMLDGLFQIGMRSRA